MIYLLSIYNGSDMLTTDTKVIIGVWECAHAHPIPLTSQGAIVGWKARRCTP
jgi:hypothetical protein